MLKLFQICIEIYTLFWGTWRIQVYHHHCQAHGKHYFWHHPSGKTQWEMPVLRGAVASEADGVSMCVCVSQCACGLFDSRMAGMAEFLTFRLAPLGWQHVIGWNCLPAPVDIQAIAHEETVKYHRSGAELGQSMHALCQKRFFWFQELRLNYVSSSPVLADSLMTFRLLKEFSFPNGPLPVIPTRKEWF